MTITQEAIEAIIASAAHPTRSTTATAAAPRSYDAISGLIGHDLADVINLGLAVLKWNKYRAPSQAMCSIFDRAGVERPAT